MDYFVNNKSDDKKSKLLNQVFKGDKGVRSQADYLFDERIFYENTMHCEAA